MTRDITRICANTANYNRLCGVYTVITHLFLERLYLFSTVSKSIELQKPFTFFGRNGVLTVQFKQLLPRFWISYSNAWRPAVKEIRFFPHQTSTLIFGRKSVVAIAILFEIRYKHIFFCLRWSVHEFRNTFCLLRLLFRKYEIIRKPRVCVCPKVGICIQICWKNWSCRRRRNEKIVFSPNMISTRPHLNHPYSSNIFLYIYFLYIYIFLLYIYLWIYRTNTLRSNLHNVLNRRWKTTTNNKP